MFRASVLVLVGILVFGVIFALLPSGGSVARSGVTLSGVKFNLYPEQDQGAVWRFQAKQVTVDPLKDENRLDNLGQGERWVKSRKVGGKWVPDVNGVEHLDLTLNATQLVIDAQDNLTARQAHMYIPDGCYSLDFRASGTQPVLINQRSGISAPSVDITAPGLSTGFDSFSSSFDMHTVHGDQRVGASAGTYPDKVCVDGQVVPRPGGQGAAGPG